MFALVEAVQIFANLCKASAQRPLTQFYEITYLALMSQQVGNQGVDLI